MAFWDPVAREHVLATVAEYDRLGRDAFLAHFGFGRARTYQLVVDGRSYDSKAVLGAAYYKATGRRIGPADFSGGVAENGAASVLRRLGFQVTSGPPSTAPQARSSDETAHPVAHHPAQAHRSAADVILIGCVKTKSRHRSLARDLYTSPLFAKRRAYAEAAGRPWFILSALHGLVAPNEELEPYDMYLSGQPFGYRSEWARGVARRLEEGTAGLVDKVIEIHAGASYVEPLQPLLREQGAAVVAPLAGLPMGEQLAWYGTAPGKTVDGDAPQANGGLTKNPSATVAAALAALTKDAARPAAGFPWGRTDLDSPGLYAWFVDRAGAADVGVAATEDLTLLYVGQAGATRWPSGTRSDATLRKRILRQHLRGRIRSSTLRRTFAALLRSHLQLKVAESRRLTPESELGLSRWLTQHLAISVWPTTDADGLRGVEEAVVQVLDPPVNLAGAAPSRLRHQLTAGRAALGLLDEPAADPG